MAAEHHIDLGQIEHALRRESSVKDAVVLLQPGKGTETRLLCFVTLRESDDQSDSELDGDEALSLVHLWGDYFDSETYSNMANVQADLTGRDFIGWVSAYDGSVIDGAEMDEWLDDTIATILDGGHSGHILEIGTGSGMVLFNLAGELQTYVGLEPSAHAVSFVTKRVASTAGLKNKVDMIRATATDLARLDKPVSPGLVILNSVIQYFPGQDYLFRIIQDIVKLDTVETIFIGDVRSMALHRTRKDEIWEMVTQMEESEPELLIDPAFFIELASRLPDRIEHVEILPKKMRADNELSCFRYAAVIYVKATMQQPLKLHNIDQEQWTDFTKQGLTRASLLELVRNQIRSSPVPICNIPNRKFNLERHIVDLLNSQEPDITVDTNCLLSLHQSAQCLPSLSAIDLVDLAREVGCQVELSWARQHSQRGGLDAIFHCYSQVENRRRVLFQFPSDRGNRGLLTLSSHPLKHTLQRKAQKMLQSMLQGKLPAHIVPRVILWDGIFRTDDGHPIYKDLANHFSGRQGHHSRIRPDDLLVEAEAHSHAPESGVPTATEHIPSACHHRTTATRLGMHKYKPVLYD
ncbi:hypothetical protein ACCO45_012574 [Purpureocillium lilacinum]|uniref:Uncharacterized protein n=1 Tax=Purpureocillium lilacinum TaxID=33203 RepID=A0ACC4DAY4_PURLI